MAETPVQVNEVKAEAAPTPPTPKLTRFRAVVQSKSGFTTESLRRLVECGTALNDELTFKITGNGVSMKVLDKARIALMEVELPAAVFVSFDADGEGYVTVDSKSLLAVVRRAKGKDIQLTFEDGQLVVTIGGIRSFRIRTLETSAEEAPQPKVNHTAFAVIDAELFREALIDAKVVKADAVRLVALNGALTFKAVNETKEAEVKLGPAEGSASSTYMLDYLVKAAKAFGDGTIEVRFGSNAPLELANSYAKIFIAPRIE